MPKLEKSTDPGHKLIISEGAQDSSACKISGHFLHAFLGKCPETPNLTMTLHNYRSRQIHETLNGVNPSSRFRDLRSAKSGPNLCQIWQVFGPWAIGHAHMGQMGKWPWQCTTTGLDNSTELRMEKIRQAVTEIWVPQIWPWRQYPSSPEGWGVKRCEETDRQTDVFGEFDLSCHEWTDWTIHRAAWLQLKIYTCTCTCTCKLVWFLQPWPCDGPRSSRLRTFPDEAPAELTPPE